MSAVFALSRPRPLHLMRPLRHVLFASLALLSVVGASGQVVSGLDLTAERVRLKAERDRVTQALSQEEDECRTRFVVTGCVEGVRRRWQVQLAELDRQERVLNDLDRRNRSSEQMLRLERKASDAEADAAERRARAASEQESREARAAAKASGPRPSGTPRQARSAEPGASAPDAMAVAPRARPSQARQAAPSSNGPEQARAKAAPSSSPEQSRTKAAPSGKTEQARAKPASARISAEQARANAAAHQERVRQAEAHKAEVRQRQAGRSKPPASDLPPPR